MKCEPSTVPIGSDAATANQDLQLLREIIAISNQTDSLERALDAALPRVAQRHACIIGQAFLLVGDRLDRLALCKASYEQVAGLAARLQTPAVQDLECAGYLRRVVERRLPQCTASLETDLSARGKAAREAGAESAIAVPVMAGADAGAVLEFFADHVIECDGGALGALTSAGVALGRVLERKRCSVAAERAERLASLGTFAAGIAHELNNPLSSILVSGRVARRQNYDKEHLQVILGEIVSDAERCALIVKNLVKFAHQKPGDRTLVNVSELIRRVVGVARRAAEAPQARLELEISEPLPAVLAEATAIEQALVSLVNGALQVSEPGQVVRIQAEESRGKVRICLTAEEDGARRTGPAFEMAQSIVKQHGGTIRIDKRRGGGSTVTIELPVSGQSPGRASE